MGKALTDDFAVLLVKPPAQVRPGQVLLPAFTAGFDGNQPMFLSKFRANFREYAVLRSGVIRPEAQKRQSLIAGAGPAHTQTGRGLCLQPPVSRTIHRVFHQILLPQVNFRNVRQQLTGVLGLPGRLGFRYRGPVLAALHLGLRLGSQLPQHLGHQGFQFLLIHSYLLTAGRSRPPLWGSGGRFPQSPCVPAMPGRAEWR